MATVKKGTLTPAPQWWKHLRDWKRVYWGRERKAARVDAGQRVEETEAIDAIDCEIAWLMSWHDYD